MDYEKQANDFLRMTGISFSARVGRRQTPPPWLEAHGERTRYCITLSADGRTPLRFEFWGSIADRRRGRTELSAYDVLACISGDVFTPETFEEFCSEFGDPPDSIDALNTFRRCDRFARRLRAFFTPAEIDALAEIH